MSYKVRQLDFEDRPLLSRQNESVWTDIGQAEVTYSLFGKAKVRIVRKHDRLRRNVLLSLAIVGALAFLIWKTGVLNLLHTDPVQIVESADSRVPRIEVMPSTPMIEPASRSSAAPAVNPKPGNYASAEHKNAVQAHSNVAQAVPAAKPADKAPPAPAAQHPLVAIGAQSAAVAASAVAATDKPQLRKPLPPRQIAASGVVAAPAATSPVSGVAAVPHAPVIVKGSDVKPLLPGDKSLANPIAVPIKQ